MFDVVLTAARIISELGGSTTALEGHADIEPDESRQEGGGHGNAE
jgi:hypothetical protein